MACNDMVIKETRRVTLLLHLDKKQLVSIGCKKRHCQKAALLNNYNPLEIACVCEAHITRTHNGCSLLAS